MPKRPSKIARRKPAAATRSNERGTQRSRLRAGASYDIQAAVPYLFNRAMTAMHDKFVVLKAYKLTIPMFRVLAILYARGPLRFSVLATLSSTELPTLSRFITRLASRRLITRSKSNDDGRGVLLDITGAGRKIVLEVFPHVIELENTALRGFSEDERFLARRLLMRICENVSPLRSYGD